MRPTSVLLIYTGGTIGMIQNHATGALESFNFESLMTHVPEIRDVTPHIDSRTIEPPIDSAEMEPVHWAKILAVIEENYSAYDGFVVLHGTDTMAFTASALSFMIEDVTKPIILTGSQLPIGALRTDGRSNLITAIEIAAAQRPDGSPCVPEVCVYFDEKLFRGNRTMKVDAENFAAFDSPNCPPLATVGVDLHFNDANIRHPRPGAKTKFHYAMDSRMLIFSLFPGLKANIVEGVLRSPDIRGIIFRTFGSGNAPHNAALTETLRKASEEGKVIVNVSQCPRGYVHQERYGTGLQLVGAGILSGYDSTIEAALTKLMFLFGQELSPDQVREQMSRSLAGEISV